MIQVLLVVQVLVAAALIGVVLIQRSDSDGFGLGSGSGSNFLTGRASANLLTRTTAILAALFIINSLALNILTSHGRHHSIVDTVVEQQNATPAAPAVPDATKETKELKATNKPSSPASR